MIYSFCGRLAARFWPLLLAMWIAVVALLETFAPSLDSVTKPGEFNYLPDDAPTRIGERLFRQAFPNDVADSSIVLIAHRDQQPLQPADREFANDVLRPELEALADSRDLIETGSTNPNAKGSDKRISAAGQSHDLPVSELIAGVRSPSDELIGGLLESEDRSALLVIVELRTDFMELRNRQLVAAVEQVVQRLDQRGAVPEALSVDVTGSAVLGRDIAVAKDQSADNVHFWTLALIIGLLMLVFRAPLLVMVPLLTLFLAFKVALKSLASASGAGWIGLFDGIEVYTMVVAYGAGVDYSMFLCARFREELENGASESQATERSVSRVGTAVFASAFTEIFGIGMLTAASFGKLHQAGITIAFALFIMLLAALTLTPAMLRAGGRWIFWPFRPDRRHDADESSLKRPLDTLWQKTGESVIRSPWRWSLLTLALLLPLAAVGVWNYDRLSYGLISQLPTDAPSIQGLSLLDRHFPAGETGHVTVLLKNDQLDFTKNRQRQAIRELTERLEQRRDELQLADIRSVVAPLGISPRAEAAVNAGTPFQRLSNQAKLRARGQSHYISQSEPVRGNATRIELVLSIDPFRRETISHLDTLETAVRQELPEVLQNGTQLTLLGPTASVRDLSAVAKSDAILINVLVVVVVLAVLIALSREVIVPFYLIGTVLLSYLVALGTTFIWFGALTQPDFPGLDWTAPLFLFTILVAVGVDYNIFLVTRIREEQREHDLPTAITRAVTRTGSIISSCGLIMAGTFSSLMIGGELARMDQLGFSLAVGILLDTFVIRPILVPAFLMIRGERKVQHHNDGHDGSPPSHETADRLPVAADR